MSKVLKTLKTIVVGGRDLKCSACGNDFVCGVSLKGCWCSEIQLDDEARAQLRAQYTDCLCRGCLEKISADGTTEPSAAKSSQSQ